MKGISGIIWLIVALGIIIVAGSGLIGMANIASFFHLPSATMYTDPATGKQCELKDGLVPLIGYYSCEGQGYQRIAGPIPIPNDDWYDPIPDEITLACCNYNVQSCTYELRRTSGEALNSITIPRGNCLNVRKDHWLTGERVVYVFGEPFALVRYSPTSAPSIVNNQNCRLPSTSNLLTKTVQYVSSGSLQQIIRPTDSLDFNQKSSFLAAWVSTPIEISFVNNKWCASGGYIYGVQIITLASGNCYAAPNLNYVIEKKLGCPGEPCSIGGKTGVIDKNYVCVLNECLKCSVLDPCPHQGRYTVDYSKNSAGTTAVIYDCINGCCEASYKTSECASNSACPVGKQCQFNDYTGIGKCVSVTPTPIPPQPGPVTGKGFDFRLLKLIGISAVFTFIMMLLGRFVARLKPIFGKLSNWKIFLLVTAILTAVFWFAGDDLKKMAIATLISAAITGILAIFIPFLRTPMIFFITFIGLSLLLIFVFAIPLANLTASIFGGAI